MDGYTKQVDNDVEISIEFDVIPFGTRADPSDGIPRWYTGTVVSESDLVDKHPRSMQWNLHSDEQTG